MKIECPYCQTVCDSADQLQRHVENDMHCPGLGIATLELTDIITGEKTYVPVINIKNMSFKKTRL
jgi:hypothetical protein